MHTETIITITKRADATTHHNLNPLLSPSTVLSPALASRVLEISDTDPSPFGMEKTVGEIVGVAETSDGAFVSELGFVVECEGAIVGVMVGIDDGVVVTAFGEMVGANVHDTSENSNGSMYSGVPDTYNDFASICVSIFMIPIYPDLIGYEFQHRIKYRK